MFQQVTGINAIIYYSDRIFAAAGFTSVQQQTDVMILAIGIATLVCLVVHIASFLSVIDVIGTEGAFALMSILAYVWISGKVPETKGKPLEETEATTGCSGQ